MKHTQNSGLIAMVGLVLSLTACQKSAIDTVKDAVFDSHPGVTIGDAFENRFENVSWEESNTAAGQVLVIFKGTTPDNANDDVRDMDKKMDAMQYTLALSQLRGQMVSKAHFTDKSKVQPLQDAKDMEEIMNIVMPPGASVSATFLIENLENGQVSLQDCSAPAWWATGCTQDILLGQVYGAN